MRRNTKLRTIETIAGIRANFASLYIVIIKIPLFVLPHVARQMDV